MSRQFAWLLVAALLTATELSAGQPQAPQPAKPQQAHEPKQQKPQDPNRWKWWLNPDSRKEIGITDAQSRQIEEIFESIMPAQRAKAREHQRLEDEVSRLLKERTADLATVTQSVEKLEKLGAEMNITRTVMLYRINQLLTPDQIEKLEAFRKRRDENRRKSERR